MHVELPTKPLTVHDFGDAVETDWEPPVTTVLAPVQDTVTFTEAVLGGEKIFFTVNVVAGWL